MDEELLQNFSQIQSTRFVLLLVTVIAHHTHNFYLLHSLLFKNYTHITLFWVYLLIQCYISPRWTVYCSYHLTFLWLQCRIWVLNSYRHFFQRFLFNLLWYFPSSDPFIEWKVVHLTPGRPKTIQHVHHCFLELFFFLFPPPEKIQH